MSYQEEEKSRLRRQATKQAIELAMQGNWQEALDHRCSGGTDFDAPVKRAIEVIRTSRTMKQADVVIITDGEDSLDPATSEAAVALTRAEGVSWFAVGVGPDAELGLQSLAPIATTMVRIKSTDDPEPIIPVINLTEK